ncbi:Ring finger domain-containing protein [Cladophialophora immunda]|nr:Ring finger domain-containing protein [Cladophialophora immunda]
MSEIDWTWIVQVAPEWWVPIFQRVMAFGTSLDLDQNEQDLYDAVRNFAITIPANLTRKEQDDFCSVFYESLTADHDRRYRLMLLFRSCIPPTTDPLSNHAANDLVRDFARNTIANLNNLDRIQTEIEQFCATIAVTRELRDVLIVQFKWSIDNLRPDFPLIMALFQGYMQDLPSDVHPHPRDRFSHFTHLLTPEMWQRIYLVRPHLAPPPELEMLPPALNFTWSDALPTWFEPALPPEPTWPEREPLHNLASEDSRMLLEACDYVYDMSSLQNALNYVTERMLDIVFEMQLQDPNEVAGQNALRILQNNMDDLRGLFFLEEDDTPDFSIEDVPTFHERLVNEQEILDQVRARNVHAERYLQETEVALLATDEKFLRAGLRYERSKYRHYFKSAVDTLRSQRLRQVDWTEDVLHSSEVDQETPVLPPFRHDDTLCPICREDLVGEDGEVAADTVVALCCHRPFHAQCMLSWLFQQMKNENDMSCPLCRGAMDTDFMADILEMEVRRMAVL